MTRNRNRWIERERANNTRVGEQKKQFVFFFVVHENVKYFCCCTTQQNILIFFFEYFSLFCCLIHTKSNTHRHTHSLLIVRIEFQISWKKTLITFHFKVGVRKFFVQSIFLLFYHHKTNEKYSWGFLRMTLLFHPTNDEQWW